MPRKIRQLVADLEQAGFVVVPGGIRGHGNKDTELALIILFRRHGITGWRRQQVLAVRSSRREEAQTRNRKSEIRNRKPTTASTLRAFKVRPDFVFPKQRVAVFVDGCFWHACPKHSTKPRNNAAFWAKKLAANQARDRRVNRTLRQNGWRVIRIWEHDLAPRHPARLLARLSRLFTPGAKRGEPPA